MSHHPAPAPNQWLPLSVFAGVISFVLVHLSAALPATLGLLFLSPTPFLTAGFCYGHRALLTSLGCFALLMLLSQHGSEWLLLLLLVLAPTYLTGHSLLQVQLRLMPDKQWQARWPSLIQSLTSLSSYFSLLLLSASLLSMDYTSPHGTGLQGIIASTLQEQLDALDTTTTHMPEEAITDLRKQLTSLPLSLFIGQALWQWILFLALNGWFAHRLASKLRTAQAIRPSVFVTRTRVDYAHLVSLLLATLAMGFGSPPLAFIGHISCIILLLPYFLSAIVHAHKRLSRWTSALVFPVFIYSLLALLLTPALLVAAASAGWHCWNYLHSRQPRHKD